MAPKCSLGNILFSHEYLIIPCIVIHEANNLMPSCSINRQINNWHRIAIHHCSFVKVPKINAYMKFSIFLVDRNNIGNPLSIPTLPNELSFNKFGYFGLNVGKNIWVTSARWLLMWPKSRFNRQPMFNNRSV